MTYNHCSLFRFQNHNKNPHPIHAFYLEHKTELKLKKRIKQKSTLFYIKRFFIIQLLLFLIQPIKLIIFNNYIYKKT